MGALTLWRAMDILILAFFLLTFEPRWLGLVVALLFGYRLMKSFLPGGNSAIHRFVDCSAHHTQADGHRHLGTPTGHDHKDDRPRGRRDPLSP